MLAIVNIAVTEDQAGQEGSTCVRFKRVHVIEEKKLYRLNDRERFVRVNKREMRLMLFSK